MPDIKRVLIFQTAYLGDVVLTTPLISALRRQFQNAKIDIVAQPAWTPLLENHPEINCVIAFDKRGIEAGLSGTFRFAGKLRKVSYDMALCPHPSFRSALILWLARIPYRIGFHDSAGSFFFTRTVRRDAGEHEVRRVLGLMEPLGALDKEYLPRISLPEEPKIEQLMARLGISGKKLVGLHPGSVWATKRWTEKGFAQLAGSLSQKYDQVLVFGGSGEKELSARITKQAGGSTVDLGGKLDLLELCAVISRLGLFVTNDSGPMHIAASFQIPIVAIFGSTVPALGYTPYGTSSRIVEVDLDCRPCGSHGFKTCPQKHFRCMKDIDVDMVMAACESIA